MVKKAKSEAASAAFLYEQVAGAIAEQIQAGDLRPGERGPSVRQVSQRFKVSLSTAVQALSELESRGLVEARPQSGFYVRSAGGAELRLEAPTALGPVAPALVETGDLIREVVAAVRDPNAVPLGASTISSALLPGAQVARAIVKATRDLGADGMQYEMPPGYEELRRQIALRAAQIGCRVTAKDVVITSGAMDAINLSLRAITQPGDTVAIESPMYYGIIGMLSSLGLKAAEIPVHPETGMDLECLENTLKKRRVACVLAIPNFNNPIGSRMPDQAKKDLVQLLARHQIPMIEDDIYGDLQHDGGRPTVCKAFDKQGLVLYCSSLSKTLAPGLRIGWVVGGVYQARIETLKFVTSIASPTVPQAAAAILLEKGGYERHLRRLRGKLRTQIAQYKNAVCRDFPAGTKCSQPTGGALLWVQLPGGKSSMKLYERARDMGIGIIPGTAFSSELGRYGDSFRLSCGSPFGRIMEDAIKRLGEAAKHL